mmetsp:Transcript_40509/g.39013  ORF Transcript_40509/g.39013 Transcript_40509/m.39013 type:complete len:191 (-) Transcript_40509:2525-3097(-)
MEEYDDLTSSNHKNPLLVQSPLSQQEVSTNNLIHHLQPHHYNDQNISVPTAMPQENTLHPYGSDAYDWKSAYNGNLLTGSYDGMCIIPDDQVQSLIYNGDPMINTLQQDGESMVCIKQKSYDTEIIMNNLLAQFGQDRKNSKDNCFQETDSLDRNTYINETRIMKVENNIPLIKNVGKKKNETHLLNYSK